MLYFIHNKYRSSIQIFCFHIELTTKRINLILEVTENQGSTILCQKLIKRNEQEISETDYNRFENLEREQFGMEGLCEKAKVNRFDMCVNSI